jgi:phenylalanyl-tRNA synthetase alpha chain
MEKMKPPIRIVIPGKVYRYETTDASHEINFYQIEGLLVDENVSVANLKAVLRRFLNEFFEREVTIRLRPSYFPFTEPSFEVDMLCTVCNGKGCPACKRSGWVEILGAGIVHPNVIKNGKLDPKKWKGFAFGMAIDRMAMMKYKINDVRLFHSGNLKFLKQF